MASTLLHANSGTTIAKTEAHHDEKLSQETGNHEGRNAPTKKQFTGLTMVSMAFIICNSWAGISGSLQLALLAGGPVTLVYSILVSTSAYFSIAGSMAELSSIYPTAGGQYHFTSILAPKKWRRGLSYTCGLLAMLSWISIGATVTMLVAEQILSVISISVSEYERKSWHIFFVYQAMVLLATIYNALALKRAPWTHTIGFFLTLSIFLVQFIGLLARSNPKQPSKVVWTSFINLTGWPDGFCFLIGLSTSCFIYIGLDAAMHMAEECQEPERVVPRTIMAAVGIGFTTAFAYAVTQLYALSDINYILTTDEWIPPLVLIQGFRSRAMGLAMVSIGVVMVLFMVFAIQETSSRLVWSLARDNGLIFSKHLDRIHPTLDIPLWALLLVWLLTFLCGFIFLASHTAFSAIVSSSIILQQLSFGIPIFLLLVQKRSTVFLPPTRSFRVPNILGWVMNTWAVAFIALLTVVLCVPVRIPTSASTMNYAVAILGVAFVLSLANWLLHARKHYNGPVIELWGSNYSNGVYHGPVQTDIEK
ncbi:hypothetical protein AJ78_07489 [Emergomyces pasteurianus Ep9510]|uniref:Choline transporter n=1 Tax=Emergomyces pasteurianus Ep9510 TaxID=1447872 RepID=A0A1J9Q6F4_9EURO|nr:hypothetical protein AJ78_07489 [Emergomyces pasteurianus Ep9510]